MVLVVRRTSVRHAFFALSPPLHHHDNFRGHNHKQSVVHAKSLGQLPKIEVKDVKTILPQFGCLRTICSFNSQMATKWYTKLKTCRKGALLSYNVICQIVRSRGPQKSTILTPTERSRVVTPIWIHRWLRSSTQSMKWHRRGTLLIFNVIRPNFKVIRPSKSTIGLRFRVSG